MTMRERILSGKLFKDLCEGLPEDRKRAKYFMTEFNKSTQEDLQGRFAAMKGLFGREVNAWIEPPFYCCYGTNITFGTDCYVNFNCSFVDDGKIIIGDRVMFGPAVTIATVGHPLNPGLREYMYTEPVTIGNNCWIGANATICPGVTIGENSVIGAGSVVVHDIPANCIAVGNPCRVLREISEYDMTHYGKDIPITREDLEELRSLMDSGK